MSVISLIQKYFCMPKETVIAGRAQEILVNGLQCLVVVKAQGHQEVLPSPFADRDEMLREIQEFAYLSGGRLDPSFPANGGEYSLQQDADNYSVIRWHAVIPPVSRDGPLLSIRQLTWHGLQLQDFCLSSSFCKYLNQAMQAGQSFVISGPTGSGKTSLMCQLLFDNCQDERIAVVESVPEIPRMSNTWIRLCSQVENIEGRGHFSLQRILEESLRLRPDRLVVGEIRGLEAAAWYQALQVVDKGSLTTLHIHHPSQLIPRLSILSGLDPKLWEHSFDLHQVILLQMQRKTPRLCEAYQFQSGSFKPIFSYDQT